MGYVRCTCKYKKLFSFGRVSLFVSRLAQKSQLGRYQQSSWINRNVFILHLISSHPRVYEFCVSSASITEYKGYKKCYAFQHSFWGVRTLLEKQKKLLNGNFFCFFLGFGLESKLGRQNQQSPWVIEKRLFYAQSSWSIKGYNNFYAWSASIPKYKNFFLEKYKNFFRVIFFVF